MKGKLLFKEEQSFVGTWGWYLILALTLITVAGLVFSLARERSLEAIAGLSIGTLVSFGVLALLHYFRLRVTIDQEFIYYSCRPFVTSERKLSKSDVKEVFVRKYQPIMEYGGWGYRIGATSGRALNVSGNIGLQLVLKDGKKVLLGTQKDKSLDEAVKRLKENWGTDA